MYLQVWAGLFKEAIPGLVQFCEFWVLHVFCLYCLHFRLEFEKSEKAQKTLISYTRKWVLRLAFNPGFASVTGFRATRQSVLKFRLRFLPLLEPEKKWANRMKEVLTRTMFTFTSFSIVVTCVSKSTRAFEWSFGITAFWIRFVFTSTASGSTLVDIWKVQRNSNIGDQMI